MCVANHHSKTIIVPLHEIDKKNQTKTTTTKTATMQTPPTPTRPMETPANRRTRRRPLSVRFAEQPATQTKQNLKRSSLLSGAKSAFDIESVWFNQNELDQFKDAARIVSRRVALSQKQMNEDLASCVGKGAEVKLRLLRRFQSQLMHEELTHSRPFPANLDASDFEMTRGLELRASFERQRRKIVAIRTILEVQRRLKGSSASPSETENRIAEVARMATNSAKNTAALAAKTDFVDAWLRNDLFANVSAVPELTPQLEPLKRSASVVSDSDSEHEPDFSERRNVRRRTTQGMIDVR